MALIHGIHHIALKCMGIEQYEKTIRFYHKTLGMPIKRSWATGTMLDIGSGLMEIFNDAPDTLPQGTIRHFALAVSDVDGCVEAVRGAGFPITMEPKDIVIPSEIPFPARIAFCIGPVGEEIEFFCEK